MVVLTDGNGEDLVQWVRVSLWDHVKWTLEMETVQLYNTENVLNWHC